MFDPTTAMVIVFLLIAFAAGGLSAAPWVPTRRREREVLLKEIPIQPGQVVYDLGCGDGIVLFQLAAHQPDARYIGIEVAPVPLLIGLVRKLIAGAKAKNVTLRLRDLFGLSYRDADVVFIFLLSDSYPKLMKKLAGTLKPDARVVVEAWPLPGIEAERVIREEGKLPMYVYRGRQLS
jgi:SAM-dependent methyltransferase